MALPLLAALARIGMAAARGAAVQYGARAIGRVTRWGARAARAQGVPDWNDHPDDGRPAAEQTKDFLLAARKRFAVPYPSQQQLQQFGQEKADERRQAAEAGAQEEHRRSLIRTTAAMVGLGTVVGLLGKMFTGAGDAVQSQAEGLRRFSAGINTALAGLERAQLIRLYERAQATSGTTSALLRARNELEQSRQPLEIAMQRSSDMAEMMGVKLRTAINEAMNALGIPDMISTLVDIVAYWTRWDIQERGPAGMQGEFRNWLKETASGKYPRSKSPHDQRSEQRPPGVPW